MSHYVPTAIISCLLFGFLFYIEISNKTDLQIFCMDNPFHAKCESNCLTNHEKLFDFYDPPNGPGYFLMKAGSGKTLINCHHRFPKNTSYYWFVKPFQQINENEMIWMTHVNNIQNSEIPNDQYKLETYRNYVNSR